MDLGKPLVRFVPITLKEKCKYPVLYEKLPNFCFFCGLIGHEVMECGDGVHNKEDCGWGNWLVVNYASNGSASVGRGGRTGGRGRGRGPGRGSSGFYEHENDDMEIYQEENAGSMRVSAGPRKRLVNDEGIVNGEGSLSATRRVASTVQMIENGVSDQVMNVPVSTPQKFQNKKRQKKDGKDDGDFEANTESATSFEGDRRTQ